MGIGDLVHFQSYNFFPFSGPNDHKKKFQQSHSVVDYQTEFTFSEMFHDLLELASKNWHNGLLSVHMRGDSNHEAMDFEATVY